MGWAAARQPLLLSVTSGASSTRAVLCGGGQSRCKAGEEAALWPAGRGGSASATTGRQTLRRPPGRDRAVGAGLHVGITSIHVVAVEKLGSRMPSLFLAAPSFPRAHSRSGCAGGGDEEFRGCLLGGEHFQVFLMQECGRARRSRGHS